MAALLTGKEGEYLSFRFGPGFFSNFFGSMTSNAFALAEQMYLVIR